MSKEMVLCSLELNSITSDTLCFDLLQGGNKKGKFFSTASLYHQFWLESMTRSGCAFAFPFSEGSCVVLVVIQEKKSLRKDSREADGSTTTKAEHVIKVWPVHPQCLCRGQRQKEKEATNFGILEQMDIWGKEQQKSWGMTCEHPCERGLE